MNKGWCVYAHDHSFLHHLLQSFSFLFSFNVFRWCCCWCCLPVSLNLLKSLNAWPCKSLCITHWINLVHVGVCVCIIIVIAKTANYYYMDLFLSPAWRLTAAAAAVACGWFLCKKVNERNDGDILCKAHTHTRALKWNEMIYKPTLEWLQIDRLHSTDTSLLLCTHCVTWFNWPTCLVARVFRYSNFSCWKWFSTYSHFVGGTNLWLLRLDDDITHRIPRTKQFGSKIFNRKKKFWTIQQQHHP